MANLITAPTFFPRRLSSYVPAMAYASDVNISGAGRVSFGAPGVALATYYLSAFSIATAAVTPASGLLLSQADAPYGRNVQVVASGAATTVVTIDGFDYLGQPMSENLTLNGATPVLGLKAFFTIRQVTTPAIAATTINLGTGVKLGLPYKSNKITTEELNGAIVGTLGTLLTPVLTVPATATTGEPRGMYTPQSTLNGTAVLTATFEFYSDVDVNNVGGLHGVPHFAN